MGQGKSWLWGHFHQGPKKNSLHWDAWCKYCINAKMLELEAAEKHAVTLGQIEVE